MPPRGRIHYQLLLIPLLSIYPVAGSCPMWGNITGVMGKALEKVQAIQSELESQMDAAVGAAQDEPQKANPVNSTTTNAVNAVDSKLVDAVTNENGKTDFSTVDLFEKAIETNQVDVTPGKAKKAARPARKARPASSNNLVPTDVTGTEASSSGPAQENGSDSTEKFAELSKRHETATRELEAKHEQKLSSLLGKIAELEQQNKQYNKGTFETAQGEWNKESATALRTAARAAEAEKAALLQEMKASNAVWEGKLRRLQEESEERVAALKAQLQEALLTKSGSDDGAPSQQEEALRVHLASKDEDLAAQVAELRQLRSTLQESSEQFTQQIDALSVSLAERDASIRKLTEENEHLRQQSAASGDVSAAKEELIKRVAEVSAALVAAQADLQAAQERVTAKDGEISAVLTDLTKVKEALSDRERALETAARNLSEQYKLNEGYVQKIADLTAEVAEKDARNRAAQSSAVEEEESRKVIARLQEQLKEQSERLAAFEKEGQSLAKKQSEMERIVRNSKKELRDKDTEIQKLKESKEQLVKAIEQTQDVLKKHESDASNASKTLSAMQAVSQASTEKIVRLEAELTAKTEEYASQRRALETAWNEANELKRAISELKAERDDLRKRIGEGTSKAMETESSRRDIEQREAVLRATNKQLQDSLQRQMGEASAREERLREEVNEMRKRWQEAVASREGMASELGNATAPLLRQISSLQESVRLKSEHWQNIESSLSERALRAENAAEVAEHKRALMEEQLLEVKQQLASCNGRLSEYQTQLASAEALVERLRKREALWSEEKTELDSKYALEVAQRQSLQSTLREIELRHKVELQELHDSAALAKSQHDLELAMAHKDLDLLRDEVAAAKAGAGGGFGASTPVKRAQSGSKLSLTSLHRAAGQNGSHDRFGQHVPGIAGMEGVSSSESSDGIASSYLTGADQLATSSLPSGEATFAAAEKLQQRSRQRDDDIQALTLQIQRLESARNALLEEVSYLSMRNAQLEEQCASVPSLRAEVERSTKRTEMLLVMLGEKEEELEAVIADMKEVKHMYRAHLDELLQKYNPPAESTDLPPPSSAKSSSSADP